MMNLFAPLNEQTKRDLEHLLPLIEKLFPIPGRFRFRLPQDVAELSRLLTSERPRRDAGYLGHKPLLSAYIRYFLPWNVFRLSRLLPALDIHFAEGDAITDLGSGPLTLPIALWICRPDLRDRELEFRCADRTGAILDAGKIILQALPSRWKVRTIRGSLGERIEGKPAKLVTAVNLFNELFWDDHNGPYLVADRYAPVLSALAAEEGSLLIVEPGIPRSGEFISLMRSKLLMLGRRPLAPCPHAEMCPLPGGRRGAKWCHFAFETDEAPEALHRLSKAAGLPKERATVSFLWAGKDSGASHEAGETGSAKLSTVALRVLSDPFTVAVGMESCHSRSYGPLPRGQQRSGSRPITPGGILGRYACSERGLVLLRAPAPKIQGLAAGSFLEVPPSSLGQAVDPKSKALVINLG